MDECEALCNRIGFMNRGTLISIGSSQHLKSRYSTSYMLTITQINPSSFSSRFLNSLVTRKFNVNFFKILPILITFQAPDTTDPATTVTQHWEIPKGKESWSAMFR
jgi:ABC-type multidrug transport system ATPase subunit